MRFPSTEFDDVVAAACHGTADEAHLVELAGLLAGNDAALEAYITRAELHASLLTWPGLAGDAAHAPAAHGLEGALDEAVHVTRGAPLEPHPRFDATRSEAPAGSPGIRLSVPGMLAGMVVVIGLLWAGLRWAGFGAGSAAVATAPAAIGPASGDAEASPRVGRVVECSAAVWVSPEAVVEPGDAVRVGERLELAAGDVRIDLTSGASVRLTGPAILAIESPLLVSLTMGRVRVTASTPESKGFTIRTRTGRIVDLGTEFTADAGPDGRCRVGVSSGSVRFHLGFGEGDAGELLRAGDVMEVEPGRRQVVTRIERGDDSRAFRFPSIESPSADDLADASRGRATIRCVRGLLYENPAKQITSAAPEILLDGRGQSGPDAPSESLYFADGEEGGLVLDLGGEVDVRKVNVYSWHRCLNPGFPASLREAHRDRAAQHYVLYGRGEDPSAGPEGTAAHASWTFVARVNSDEHFGLTGIDRPAQQASSVTSARGTLGRFRYLLFVIQPTVGTNHDGQPLAFGTFCGEIDVYGEEPRGVAAPR
jgi:hypothetical protein